VNSLIGASQVPKSSEFDNCQLAQLPDKKTVSKKVNLKYKLITSTSMLSFAIKMTL
jgi:hypothetical protein